MALTGERTQRGEEVRAVLRYLVTAIERLTNFKTMMARPRLQSLGHDDPLPPPPASPTTAVMLHHIIVVSSYVRNLNGDHVISILVLLSQPDLQRQRKTLKTMLRGAQRNNKTNHPRRSHHHRVRPCQLSNRASPASTRNVFESRTAAQQQERRRGQNRSVSAHFLPCSLHPDPSCLLAFSSYFH